MVPRMKAAGADVVIVSCHSGATTSSSYGDALPYPENASRLLAEQVPDIDAILVGHAHVEIPQRKVTNKVTGREVLLSEPLYWGMRVSVMDLDLVKVRGRWTVASSQAHPAQRQHGARGRADRRPGAAGPREGAHLRQQRHRHLHARRCRPRPRATRTPRRWTSSTWCRRRPSRPPWWAPRRQACRCCRSRRRSTRTPPSPRGRSPCATSRGSTSSTTRCWASRSPVLRSRTTSRRRLRTSARSAGPGRSRHPP